MLWTFIVFNSFVSWIFFNGIKLLITYFFNDLIPSLIKKNNKKNKIIKKNKTKQKQNKNKNKKATKRKPIA